MSDPIKLEVASNESETLKCLHDIKELLTLLLVRTEGKPWRDVKLDRELGEVVAARDQLGYLLEKNEARLYDFKMAELNPMLGPWEELAVNTAKCYWAKNSNEMNRFKANKLTFKDLCVGIGRASNNKNPTRLMRKEIDVPLRNAIEDELVNQVLKRLSKADSELLGDYLGRVKGASLSKFPLSAELFESICVIINIKGGMDPDIFYRFFL